MTNSYHSPHKGHPVEGFSMGLNGIRRPWRQGILICFILPGRLSPPDFLLTH